MLKWKNIFRRNIVMCTMSVISIMSLLAIYICFVFFQGDLLINLSPVRVNERNLSIDLQLQETRATYLTVQTKISPGWCRMQASALLSGISVVSLGFGGKYSPAIRPRWILQFIEENNLKDNHVLVFLDGGDTFFTGGLTMEKAITNFINTTAATADEFDPKAVMDGEAAAPFLFGAEEYCWGADNWYSGLTNDKFCRAQYTRAYKNGGYAFLPEYRNSLGRDAFENVYLDAGTFISRVWAFKQAAMMYHARLDTRKGFQCDQSIWTSVFLECTLEFLSNYDEKCSPRGLISLDYRNKLALHPYGRHFTKNYRPWSRSAIEHYLANGKPPFPHFFNLADNPNATPGIAHFPRWRWSFFSDIPRMLETTAWVRESHQDRFSFLRSTQRLRSTATVKAYQTDGKVKVLKYGDVCSADKVMSVRWLGMRLSKQ